MTKNYLKTEIGERINQPDLQHGVEASQRDALAQLMDFFGVGYDNTAAPNPPRFLILYGFEITNPSGNIVRVNKDPDNVQGSAIMAAREKGEVIYGLVESGGDSQKDIDITGYPAGVYGIYVRLDFRDAEFQNRPFWNATAPTPVEFPRNIPTRRAENWAVTIELTSPGAEWMQIGTVDRTGIVLTDLRRFFFEPNTEANNHLVTDTEWGGGSDRSIVRTTGGVFGLYRFVLAVQRQLQDIIGGTFPFHGWWAALGTAGARSLVQLNTEKLARDGSQTMDGDLIADSNTRQIGTSGARWGGAFFNGIVRAAEFSPRSDAADALGTAVLRFLNLYARNHYSDIVDGYKFQSAVTCHHWISGHEFLPDIEDYTSTEFRRSGNAPLVSGRFGAVQLTPSVGNPTITSDIMLRLPQGATITAVQLNGSSNDASDTLVGLIRQTHDLNAATYAESLISTATPGGANPATFPLVATGTFAHASPYSVPVDQNLTIDNELYKYVLKLQAQGGVGAQFFIGSVKVTYTLPALRPA